MRAAQLRTPGGSAAGGAATLAAMPALELLQADAALLGGLFAVSFVAATVVPLGSELWLVALLRSRPDLLAPALVVANLGNTLGGLTSYALGRLGKAALRPQDEASRPATWLRERGAPALALAWLPVVGDLLCVLAGWMRVPLLAAALWMALGKLARYAALAWASLPG